MKPLAIALIATFLLVYSPTYTTPFIMDDSHTIQQNQFVHSLRYLGMPWVSAKAYSSSPENYGYRPLTTNFSQVMWAIGGGGVIPFQVAKKLLLILVAWFCFLMWKEWRLCQGSKQKGIWWGQALAFGFFLLHPVGTQVANYIAASSTLICALFYSLGLFFYFKYRRLEELKYLIFSGLAYFLAMMAKEEGVTLIGVVLVCEIFFLRRSKALPVLFGVAVLAVGLIVAHFEPSSNIARGNVPRDLYFATQWRAYFFYLSSYFWPFQFNFDNLDFQFAKSFWTFTNMVFLSLNALLVSTGIYLCWKKNQLGLAILGFYISILPASSVIPLAEAVNDHRHFIPFLFFAYGMVVVLEKYGSLLVKNPRYRLVACLLIFTFLSGATLYRNLDFVSNKTLWIDTVLKNPGSPRAKNNLALVYMGQADYSTAELILNKCMEEAVYYYPCFINKAITSATLGNDQEAENYFKRAAAMDKNYISSRLFYSDFLVKRGRHLEARALLEEADRFASGLNKPIHDRLADIQQRLVQK
jgi:protein O-mannosyl-transferase